MKKLTSTLGVFALAIGAVAAMAMSPAPKRAVVKSSATNYHWFSLGTGSYLGYDSDVNKQTQCGPQIQDCVVGYPQIDENEEPVGTPITLRGDKQLQ